MKKISSQGLLIINAFGPSKVKLPSKRKATEEACITKECILEEIKAKRRSRKGKVTAWYWYCLVNGKEIRKCGRCFFVPAEYLPFLAQKFKSFCMKFFKIKNYVSFFFCSVRMTRGMIRFLQITEYPPLFICDMTNMQ